MNEKGSILAEELEYAIGALERTLEGLGDDEFKFKPTPVSNSVQWQLNHISRIVNTSLPRLIKGVTEYTPKGWPEDYRDKTYGVEKLMGDIEAGKKAVFEGFNGLESEALYEEIPLWGGTRKRDFALFAYLGEIINHKGQVAALRGNIKRRREKDPDFLK